MNKTSLELGALGSEAVEALANLIRNKTPQQPVIANPNAEEEDGQPPYKSAAEGDLNSFEGAFEKAKELKPKKNKVNPIPAETKKPHVAEIENFLKNPKPTSTAPKPKVHSTHKSDIFKKMMQHKLPIGIGLGVAGLSAAAFLQHKNKKD